MDEVSEELENLLNMWKSGDLPEELQPDLFSQLEEVSNVKGLVTSEPFNFTETEYKTLMQQKRRGGSFQRTSQALARPDKEVESEEGSDFSDFVSKMWGKARDTGIMCVQEYTQRASEMGYVDDEGEVQIQRFVRDALEFYSEWKPKQELIEQELTVGEYVEQFLARFINIQRSKMIRTVKYLRDLMGERPELEEDLAPLFQLYHPRLIEAATGGEKAARGKRERAGR